MRVPVRIAVTLWTAAALCVGVAVTAEAASYTPVSNPANNFAPVPDFDVAVNNPCAANSTLVVDVVKIACSSYIVGAI